MTRLAFVDTETTGLSLEKDQIWEFAAIIREPGKVDVEHHFFIDHRGSLCRLLPEKFREDHMRRFPRHGVPRMEAAAEMWDILAGPESGATHIVGAVPNFDTERIAKHFYDERPDYQIAGWPPKNPWHYHLIDIENLIVGLLAGQGHSVALPWRSDDISRLIGVEPPSEADRHTAMGDARWARDVYDAVMNWGATHSVPAAPLISDAELEAETPAANRYLLERYGLSAAQYKAAIARAVAGESEDRNGS